MLLCMHILAILLSCHGIYCDALEVNSVKFVPLDAIYIGADVYAITSSGIFGYVALCNPEHQRISTYISHQVFLPSLIKCASKSWLHVYNSFQGEYINKC